MKVVNRLKVKRTESGHNINTAENIGAAAFAFLAAEPDYFSRFANLTGLDLSDIAEIAGTRQFLSGVLEYLLSNESLLLSFCQNNDFQPQAIQKAQISLTGNPSGY